MLTTSEALQADIERAEHELAGIDRDIEGRERRLSELRQHRERKWRRLWTLREQLRREEAPQVKPQGHAVQVAMPNGDLWMV